MTQPTQASDNIFPNAAIYDEDEMSFSAGDIWIVPGSLPTLSPFDWFKWLDQRSEEESVMACTIVWPINQAYWIDRRSPDNTVMLDYIDWATKNYNPPYVIGKWWNSRFGTNAMRKKRNIDNPTKKIVFFTGTIWDDIFREAYHKNYMIWLTYKWNANYNWDFSKEWILDWKDYKPSTYWHRNNALGTWAVKDMVWMFDNYDGRLPFNRYSIKYMSDLVKNGVFYPTYYLIVPESYISESPESIAKKKMDHKANQHALYALSSAYDSSSNPIVQSILADAANKIRTELKLEKDTSSQNAKAKQSLANSLTFLWNFIEDPDIQKDISELAKKVRSKYNLQ